MAYLATTCTPAEIDAKISSKLADSSNSYWTADEVEDARNEAIAELWPKFRLKDTDTSLDTSTTTNKYTVPAEVAAYGDDAIIAIDVNGVIITDWEVWNGTIISPRQGLWSADKEMTLYYIKPFTSPPGDTLDVPPTLQPLVVMKSAIKLIDKKLIEANKELSSHWYGLKRQWLGEATKMEAEIESLQKTFMVAGEVLYDGGHGVIT